MCRNECKFNSNTEKTWNPYSRQTLNHKLFQDLLSKRKVKCKCVDSLINDSLTLIKWLLSRLLYATFFSPQKLQVYSLLRGVTDIKIILCSKSLNINHTKLFFREFQLLLRRKKKNFLKSIFISSIKHIQFTCKTHVKLIIIFLYRRKIIMHVYSGKCIKISKK